MYNFVLGAYAYWGPKAGLAIFQMVNGPNQFKFKDAIDDGDRCSECTLCFLLFLAHLGNRVT